jgi:hypothetical protein
VSEAEWYANSDLAKIEKWAKEINAVKLNQIKGNSLY